MRRLAERVKAMWRELRLRLITLLGGFTEQHVHEHRTVYYEKPSTAVTLRSDVHFSREFLRSIPVEMRSDIARDKLRNSLMDKVVGNDIVDIRVMNDPISGGLIYRAELMVIKVDAPWRGLDRENEEIETVLYAPRRAER